MKEVLYPTVVGIAFTLIIVFSMLGTNPFTKILLFFKRKKVVLSGQKKFSGPLHIFDESKQSEEIKAILPSVVLKKYSIVYEHSYKGFENSVIFKSSNEKWGALQFDPSTNEYRLIAEAVYDSMAFYPQNLLFEAVFSNKSSSGNTTRVFINNEGRIIKKITNYEYTRFDAFGNLITFKNHKYGLLNSYFEEQIPCKYLKLTGIKKDLFIVTDNVKQQYLLINEKEEILYTTPFPGKIFESVCKEKLIVQEKNLYYLFDIITHEKTQLKYDLIYPISRLYDFTKWPVTRYITVTHLIDTSEDYDEYAIEPDTLMTRQGKYGIIYGDGEVCIPNIYDKMIQIHNDHFQVALGEFSFEIDDEKEEIISTGGKWGVVNTKNEIIVPIQYTNIYFHKYPLGYTAYEGGVSIGYHDFNEGIYWGVKDSKPVEFGFKE
ncbi:hypothetical protein EGY05_17075 [Chryseobacterium arthrosphaerae]|uniref:hypothetical protein n=1 Tax=Chryseobacterium arthrosphaerae TaxID=651561 RepID=UPI000F5027E7|nr:hypothetical protein [Chryseobacterium arthrosphaerae]AYZ13546.1 hypothetical protein EGY05_17075 [Chryseobacterium arthrosphaerae]